MYTMIDLSNPTLTYSLVAVYPPKHPKPPIKPVPQKKEELLETEEPLRTEIEERKRQRRKPSTTKRLTIKTH